MTQLPPTKSPLTLPTLGTVPILRNLLNDIEWWGYMRKWDSPGNSPDPSLPKEGELTSPFEKLTMFHICH